MAVHSDKSSEIERAQKLLAQRSLEIGPPRSLRYATRGIHTSHDFANFMSALMSDVIDGRVAPNVANAACNAGGKLLKVVELQYKHGTAGKDGAPKTLLLSDKEDPEEQNGRAN